jgi:iron complex outermembrane receptor protein
MEKSMNELIEKLHETGCSCVISNKEVRTYTHRGVDDLYKLLTQEPSFLANAEVADRVIGKAAAALLVKGGVKNVYADLISLSALTLLREAGVTTYYDQLVTYIKNTRLTDWCPVEALCYNEQTVDEILPVVQQFVEDKEKFFKKQG